MSANERSAGAPYRGRLAPSPTGHLHLGHAQTFWVAQQRARAAGGTLILRNEDLDGPRCKPEFVAAMMEDLRWFGFEWQEGPDCGGPFSSYHQSERVQLYRAALDRLRADGFVYPCTCSRKDIQQAASAPQAGDDELIYPGTCRPEIGARYQVSGVRSEASKGIRYQVPGVRPEGVHTSPDPSHLTPDTPHLTPDTLSWRFRVPDGETISFVDNHFGPRQFTAGKDFGDFVVWRPDDIPAYQLACVVDDNAMRISEVVRGADLLVSTARQLLLYRALQWEAPSFYHCDLFTDESGQRLAKRHAALSLRQLRAEGRRPEDIRLSLQL